MKKAAPAKQKPAQRKLSVSFSPMYDTANTAKTDIVMISCSTFS